MGNRRRLSLGDLRTVRHGRLHHRVRGHGDGQRRRGRFLHLDRRRRVRADGRLEPGLRRRDLGTGLEQVHLSLRHRRLRLNHVGLSRHTRPDLSL